jgi:hypothetical protein
MIDRRHYNKGRPLKLNERLIVTKVFLARSMYFQVKKLAKTTGRPMAELIREALEAKLAETQPVNAQIKTFIFDGVRISLSPLSEVDLHHQVDKVQGFFI